MLHGLSMPQAPALVGEAVGRLSRCDVQLAWLVLVSATATCCCFGPCTRGHCYLSLVNEQAGEVSVRVQRVDQ